MTQHASFIQRLMRASANSQPSITDMEAWRQAFKVAPAGDLPIDRALLLAVDCDRLAFAFGSGYQSALQSMIPGLSEDHIGALCVTEERGNRPRHIETALAPQGANFVVNGRKKFISCALEADCFIVAVNCGSDAQGRALIEAVVVRSDAPGVSVKEMAPFGFVPELSHGELSFDNVLVNADQRLPGDGYQNYMRPFRTVEDIHVNGAVLGYLLGAAQRNVWPESLKERLLLLIMEARELSTWEPADIVGNVLLAAHLRQVTALVSDCEAAWQSSETQEAARWQQDKKLLGVAGSMREQRLQKARSLLTEFYG